MDNNKFFRIIWRINAILVLLALIAVGSISAYKEVHRWLNPWAYYGTYNYSTSHTDADTGDVIETHWTYGMVQRASSSPGSIIPLLSERDQRRTIRNLLFVDNDLENRWVLPHNDNIIWSYELLAVGDDSKVVAIIYDISKCNDDWCEEWSGQSIYLSRPDGSELTQVVAGSSRRIGQSTIDENNLVVYYVKDEQGYAAKVSLIDFTVTRSVELSPVD